MISRRNIRIKVMQTIYALEASQEIPNLSHTTATQFKISAEKRLNEEINNAADLFTSILLYMTQVAQYAEKDARNRSSKYLPTQEDLNVDTKIAGNQFLWELLENQTFAEKVKDAKLVHAIDEEWIKKLYQKLVQSEAYHKYISNKTRIWQEEKKMMQFIWTELMLKNEAFIELLSEQWINWDDDSEMIEMLMGNYFRNSKNVNFLKFISSEKKEYALQLLDTVIDKDDYLMELISPKLKNWDVERIANIDTILLRMGIAEFLYFPTIPTKATINEYIEIAKNYSTPQSGQFINGVLDNLLKDLLQQNKIRKIERPARS